MIANAKEHSCTTAVRLSCSSLGLRAEVLGHLLHHVQSDPSSQMAFVEAGMQNVLRLQSASITQTQSCIATCDLAARCVSVCVCVCKSESITPPHNLQYANILTTRTKCSRQVPSIPCVGSPLKVSGASRCNPLRTQSARSGRHQPKQPP